MRMVREMGMLAGLALLGSALAMGAQEPKPPPEQDSTKPAQDSKTGKRPDGPVVTQNGKTEPGAAVPVPKAGDAVFAPTATPGPQTFEQRTISYMKIAYGPGAVFSPLVPATYRTAFPKDNFPREWRQGPGGFGRNYGDALISDVTLETAKYVTAAALHEDFRYRPSTSTNYLMRATHSLKFTIIDKSDSGNNRFAVANFVGALAGAYVGNAYLPDGYNDVSHADVRAATGFAGLVGHNLATEFSPEIRAVAKKLHLPFPREGGSGWWTKGFGDDE